MKFAAAFFFLNYTKKYVETTNKQLKVKAKA